MRPSVSRCSSTAAFAAQRHLGLAAQDGERRAQLVADVGEEQHPHVVEPLQPPLASSSWPVRRATSSSSPAWTLEQLPALRLEAARGDVELAARSENSSRRS